MILISPAFEDGAMIPRKFACDGGDMNPELQIENVPPGARSLALLMHDPDAPVEGGFTHWVVWNISPETVLIKEESVPPGAHEGESGNGKPGYVGPCPPSGTHRYEFTLYAVDTELDLPPSTGRDGLIAAIRDHIVEKAVLTGVYSRG